MDFHKLTTDDVLAALPTGDEDNRWELKSASLLEPGSKGELKKELGKQVSAFANSGGGYIVFGVSSTRHLEACVATVGRQPMRDYLSTLVEQSVEYPIRDFNVHQIPFTADSSKCIYIIAIADCLSAPHQAKDECQYYYRTDGHSKPAPHFHIELLRNRYTKAVVEAKYDGSTRTFLLAQSEDRISEINMRVFVRICLSNLSQQIAHPCAVSVSHDPSSQWSVGSHGTSLAGYELLQHDKTPLFPTLTIPLTVSLSTRIIIQDGTMEDLCVHAWNALCFRMQALSNNYAGPMIEVWPSQLTPDSDAQIADELRQHLESHAKSKERALETAKQLQNTMKRLSIQRR